MRTVACYVSQMVRESNLHSLTTSTGVDISEAAMDKKQAIEAIRNNWPDSRYSMLREALDIAIAAIEESMVQKPATNNARDEYGI